MRKGDIDDLGAGFLEPLDTLLPERVDFFRQALDPVFFWNAYLHALHAAADILLPVGRLDFQRGGILRIMAAHDLEQDGRVFDRLGDRTRLIERRGEGDHAIAAGAAVSRLDAHGAREGCRLADRAPGVGRGCREAEIARNGGGRAARRATGGQALIVALAAPGVDRRPEARGLVGRAHGELVHVELAQHDGAFVPEVLSHGGFVGGCELTEDARAGGRAHACRAVQVLDAKRRAVELSGLAFGPAGIRRLGHFPRLFRRLHNIGIEDASLFDGRDEGIGQFDRRKLLRFQPVQRFGKGQGGEIGHRKIPIMDPAC